MESIYIDGISMRNFKSFKKVDVQMPRGFTCIIGRNGCGKSNIIDGICFALGESSLKQLRAKKVVDLINDNADRAEVTVFLTKKDENEKVLKKYEVKRMVKRDGKVKYRLNGKNTTRTNVLSVMSGEGVHIDHNIIMQGEVETILKMSPKERRTVIEQAAGISEFEERKKEILAELAEVDQKISDISILLNEKKGSLEELKRDRDDAIRYKDLREREMKLKATLIKNEYAKAEKEHEKTLTRLAEIDKEINDYNKEIKAIDSEIGKLNKEREEIEAELRERGETKQIEVSKELDNLRSTLEVNKSKKAQLTEQIDWLGKKITAVKSETDTLQNEEKIAKEELKTNNALLEKLQKELDSYGKEFGESSKNAKDKENRITTIRKELDDINNELMKLREERIKLETNVESNKRIVDEKKIALGDAKKLDVTQTPYETLKEEKGKLDRQLNSLYEEERNLNRELPEVERDYLEKRTKYTEILARYGSGVKDSPVNFINEQVKAKKLKGIEGSVGDLLGYGDDIATAVEIAAGARLNYVVASDVDSAIKAIEALKRNKSGRLSFIPMDKIKYNAKTESDVKLSKSADVVGFVVDLIKYDSKYIQVFNYVFGNTLLVKDTEAMKAIGVGKIRMVTLDGELAEASGVISGGNVTRAIISQKKIDELKSDVNSLAERKKSIMDGITGIREELSEIRRKITEYDIKIKEIEVRNKVYQEEISSREKEKEKLAEEIVRMQREITSAENRIDELNEKIGEKEGKRKSQDSLIGEMIEASGQIKLQELNKKVSAVEKDIASKSTLSNSLDEKLKDLQKRIFDGDTNRKNDEKEAERICSEIKSIDINDKEMDKLVGEKSTLLNSLSSKIKNILAKKGAVDEQINQNASKKGKVMFDIEKMKEEKGRLDIIKATVGTKIIDLSGEYEEIKNVEPLEITDKFSLETELNKCKDELQTFANVNMKAIEVYEEKAKEMLEVEGKTNKLREERGAVLRGMEEIEHKKAVVFMDAFDKIAKNFSEMFSQVFGKERRGKIILERDGGRGIFESGVSFVIEEGKEQRQIASKSGGEKALLTLMFLFSLLLTKPAPFYILDEVDAALDKENSKMVSEILRRLSERTQIIAVTHNDSMPTKAHAVLGVVKTGQNAEVVGVKIA